MTYRSSAARVPAATPTDGPAESRPARSAENTPSLNLIPTSDPIAALIVVPTLHAGAADIGALELARVLAAAGHKPIVVSRGGRLEPDLAGTGAAFVRLDVASYNPLAILRNAAVLVRLIRERKCRVIHAHGRAGAWSAYVAARTMRIPFLTSWYKGFREQNAFKRIYNGIMAKGDRIVAVNEQIAELIGERYRTAWKRIAVVPASVDVARFDPAAVTAERVEAVRREWGIGPDSPDTKVVLVVGRMLRRKGHHVAVQAARRLKEAGVRDFVVVFVGEDEGHSRYSGELWDLVLATGTADVVRLARPAEDLPATYAAATVAVSAAVQPEGMQRALLEAQAMACPVVASDLGAGADVVLAAPSVPEDRITGLRVPAGDEAALAAALIRLFAMPEASRRAIGTRGRQWVVAHYNVPAVAAMTLTLYGDVIRSSRRS